MIDRALSHPTGPGWSGKANRRIDAGEQVGGVDALNTALTVLGLESVFEASEQQAGEAALALLSERERARAESDFERADALRDQLLAEGWAIRDTPQGPTLRPV